MILKNIFEAGRNILELSDKANRFYLPIIALLIFFAYLPTLQYDYVSGDQWRTFQYSLLNESPLVKAHKCYHDRIYHDLRTGRPFCSIGECMEHSLVEEISDFSTTRPIVLVLVLLTAFCVGMALSPSLGGIINGTAIGALFIFSPGYAFMYHLGLSGIMILISLILATLSYVLVRRIITDAIIHKNKLLLHSAIFLVACMIYPAWAFVVFIFALIDFLFCPELEIDKRLKHFVIKIIFFTIISIIYYLIIKLIIIFLPAGNMGAYEFSSNFNPVYLSKRLLLAFMIYIAQPPLNSLYSSLRILNIIFLFFVIIIGSVLYFKNKTHTARNAALYFFITIVVCAFSIFASLAPWLVSRMPGPGNRHLIIFSLLMCVLIGWVIFRVSIRLFPAKKYISTILIILIILLPAAAVQNKRTAIEAGISGTEIEAMRLVVHKWIDEYSFAKERYIVVVIPKRPRPLFYDRVLNNVKHIGSYKIPEDPLYFFNMFTELIKKKNDSFLSGYRLIQDTELVGYGDSLEFAPNPVYYFKMFTALIREECDLHHPLGLMTIYDLSFAQEKAEEILDDGPFNIAFVVINQGEQIETKHDVLAINFSLITNFPEPLIVNKTKDRYRSDVDIDINSSPH
ncbi:MAG: hypothetical protein LLG40_05035 [Deltaproteobacteria bacterium]|nr:hypothetical protein [Deltaproteobacteria bacterium]